MRTFSLLASIFVLSSSAYASDTMTPETTAPVGYDWSGFYVGAQVGGTAISGTLESPDFCNGSGICVTDLAASQVLVGTFAGFATQMDNVVLGIEAGANAKSGGTTSILNGFDAYQGDWMTTSSWDASLVAKLGFLLTPEVQAFGSAGLAAAGFSLTNSTCPECADWTDTNLHGDVRYGWIVGGGIEYALSPSMRLRGQATYSDFGVLETTVGGSGNRYRSTLNAVGVSTGVSFALN